MKTYTLSKKEVSEKLGVSPDKVDKLVKSGKLTRERKNPENTRSQWLYSEYDVANIEPVSDSQVVAPASEEEDCDCEACDCEKQPEAAQESIWEQKEKSRQSLFDWFKSLWS